ncbi:MAG: hypothetical protein ACXIVF_11725 [Rhizobiaceae bacterium]
MKMQKIMQVGATALVFAVALSVSASAQRPDARNMTCQQVNDLITSSGAVVLTTGQHTYDRYVASSRYCSYPHTTRPDNISTRDGACTVQRCGEPLFDRFRRH